MSCGEREKAANLTKLQRFFNRISRDRYITPQCFSLIAYRYATRIFNNAGTAGRELSKKYFAEEQLGIFKGRAPFQPNTYAGMKFKQFLKALPKHRSITDARIEMQILKLTIEEIRS